MKRTCKRTLSMLLVLVMVLSLLPMMAFAEAGDWDPLTSPDDVQGTLVGNKSFTASTTADAGSQANLRMMPILDDGSYYYNAMAYCGATASSSNPSIVSIAQENAIHIGKWVDSVFDNADCLEVTVDAKAAGTALITVNFYYTFSQHPTPFQNPKAQWFYGTMYYTVTVKEAAPSEYTVTYTDGVDGKEIFKDQSYTVKSGESTPAFQIDGASAEPSREGYVFLGWSPEVAETVTADVTYTAQWEEKLTGVTLKSSIREGALLFLNDQFTVTATANTAAAIVLQLDAGKGEPFEQVGKQVSEDGKTATFTYRVKQITAAYTRPAFTATATKGKQTPVTGTLSFGVNLRNRIHVTVKRSNGSVIENATVTLNHAYPQWNKPLTLTYKNGEYRANNWDISNQLFSSVTIELDGQTYSISKDVKGRDLRALFSEGKEEVYVEYVIVDPITVEIFVNGESVGSQTYYGTAGEKLNYSAQLNTVIQNNIMAEGRTMTSLSSEGLTDNAAVFGSCTKVTVSITTN